MVADKLETIGEVVSFAAHHCPDKTALRDRRGDLTYQQLATYSFGVADVIAGHGVAAGDRVVLILEQGIAAVAAMLGVVQAGACFVPIDANEPIERLQYIVNDSMPGLIITDNNEVELQQLFPRIPAINMAGIEHQDTLPGHVVITPESAAYIMYTSGSTGNPKGVCQNHRNLLHFADTYATTLGVGSDDILSMLYSMNFSASNMDIFSSLLRRATVSFYDLKKRGLTDLEGWMTDEKITVLHTVPSVFRHLVHNTTPDYIYSSVRAIDLGGEAVYRSDMPLLARCFLPECRCFNHLAMTEASVIAQHRIQPENSYEKGLLPVGPAADGVHVFIINGEGEEVSPPEVGEIVIESDYLSTGYWRQDKLTQAAFEVGASGRRRFRSGDLGFFDDTGALNYVGRRDFRVKINGVTIELGEIESCLLSLPDIAEAVVIAHQVSPEAEKILVAFYRAKPSQILTGSMLRQALQPHLPQHMIPAFFVAREELPATATGKIDRKKLMPTAAELYATDGPVEMPEGDLEKGIATIFSSLLHRERIGRHENFFESGGTSLTAMNLVMLLEKNYQVDIPLELLSSNADIASIARYLEAQTQKGKTENKSFTHQALLVPLKIHNKAHPLFLVHGRDGHALVAPHFINLLSVNHSLYAFRARGLKHGERPNLSIEGMAAEYIQEVRAVQPAGPYFLCGLCAGSVVALEMAKQLSRVGERVAPVLLFDPPVRAVQQMPLAKKCELVRDMYPALRSYNMEDYQGLANGLAIRAKEGKIDLDVNDDATIGVTAHVVIGMNIAMNTYLPHPYDGDVLIICSKKRFESRKKFGDTLITGRLKFFIVGHTHNDVLDPKNEGFVMALNKCLTLMGKS